MVNRNEYEDQAQNRELTALLDTLPFTVRQALNELPEIDTLVEVVLDLGRPPQARFPQDFVFLGDAPITNADLAAVEAAVSGFGTDNRAGIEQTLHRISAIRNRTGKIVGFTCRVGRAVFGTIDIILDVVRSGKSICLLGPPGVGKTTILRECARVLSEDRKRVVIVDTSNEIGGDGDIPHAGIGHARRMQVADAAVQHRVMVEAVENHMPQVIVIDEIGSELEALAARTIAERGVQLIGTAHGKTLENLLMNPTLSDLVGGIESVTLSDDEARRRDTRKTVLERKAPPTFDILIEIDDRNRFSIHQDVAEAVDAILTGQDLAPEIRQRGFIAAPVNSDIIPAPKAQPVLRVVQEPDFAAAMRAENARPRQAVPSNKQTIIFPYGISHAKLRAAIEALGLAAEISHSWDEADLVLSLKDIERKASSKLSSLAAQNIPVVSVKANTATHVEAALKGHFNRAPGRRDGRRKTDTTFEPATHAPSARPNFQLRHRKTAS